MTALATGGSPIGAMKYDCARCHQREGSLNVRNERLCKECFLNYVGVKVSKRMESNNLRSSLRDEPTLLLVALSLGTSSLALLHVLDENTKRQCQKTGRAGYNLQILLIDPPGSTSSTSTDDDMFSMVQERYPSHTYIRLPLEDVLDRIPSDILDTVHPPDRQDDEEQTRSQKSSRFQAVLAKITSTGSRGDVINILRDKLIASAASKVKADAILYGDSTTRLAEKTLAETARGKGAFVPWLTADRASPRGVPVIYPMRDLLRKELLRYVELVGQPLHSLITESSPPILAPTSSKDVSIDSLMQQYFSTVEEQYPSIVANVVRTSGKLIAPLTQPQMVRCSFCDLPIIEEGDQNDLRRTTGQVLCHGCRRIIIKPG